MFEDDFIGDAASNALPAEAEAAAPSRGVKRKKNRSEGERGVTTAAVDTSCFAEECEEPRLVSKRWCSHHSRCWDNLFNQAKKAGEQPTLQKAVSTPKGAQRVFEDYDRENPPHAKYARKTLVQWGQFKRVHQVSTTFRARDGCKPFEQKQWLKRCEAKMGWTTLEAKAQWQKWLDSDVDRDNEGLNNSVRLWIPVIEERHIDKERMKASVFEETGDREAKIDQQLDLKNALINHLDVANGPSEEDAFLHKEPLAGAVDFSQRFETPTKSKTEKPTHEPVADEIAPVTRPTPEDPFIASAVCVLA